MTWIGVMKVDFDELSDRQDLGPKVWVMNHPTIMDCVYLLSRIPNSTPIYKDAIASNPFYGCIAKLADFLPNAVGPDMIRAAVERLQRGEDVLIFPEGTRSTDMQVDQFKGGFALIALRARAPIELLWIDNPPDFLTREVSVWRLPQLPARIRIRSLGVVRPQPGENATSLRNRVAERYQSHMEGEAIAS